MAKATLGDAEIYYESHGSGSGAPVLLVPGLGGVGAYWKPNLPAFSAKHRVIVHDHRGTGQSSASKIRYSVDQMAGDLVRLMDHLEIERAHLVGHSTGGAMGQTLAAKHPERLASLVLYASWTKCDPFFAACSRRGKKLLIEAGAAPMCARPRCSSIPDWWINQNLAPSRSARSSTIPVFPPPEIAASRIDAIVAFDRTAHLPRIKTPTLVICAKDDILTPPYFSRRAGAEDPRRELVLLERGGHCASETALEAFNAAVLGFIAR